MPARWITRAAFAALFVGLLVAGFALRPAGAATAGLRFPAPAGTQWQIIAGYNTATHLEEDPYAIDVVRTDGASEGTPVLSPISGRVGYVGSDCLSVNDETVSILICHVNTDPGVDRGQRVRAGQRLAEVAPPGEAGNNGYPHIHIAINEYEERRSRDRDRGRTDEEEDARAPLPFTGRYAIDGVSLPPVTASNAHYLTRITSTNDASLGALSVDAGPDIAVEAGKLVTIVADSRGGLGDIAYEWTQLDGPTVELAPLPQTSSAAFMAPEAPGSVVRFRVTAYDSEGEWVSDTVLVTVRGLAPAPAETRGRIISGSAPDGGVGLVVFGGGTNAELVAAEVCPAAPALSFWATVEGRFVSYIPAAVVPGVNAAWEQAYPDGLPASVALLVRCA